MNEERLKYLLDQYRLGRCSPTELAELDEWFHAYNPGEKSMENWLNEKLGAKAISMDLYSDFKQRLYTPAKVVRFKTAYKMIAAAAFVGALLFFFYPNENARQDDIAGLSRSNNNQAKPNKGHNQKNAILVLADGSTVLIDSNVTLLATQGNTEIKQMNKNTISYNYTGSQPSTARILYNTFTTPRGGKYILTLADGTVVTLDAESSITFPVEFTGKDRRVEIAGQAYFEVVHNAAQPFFVVAKGQTIEDIGTAFNVNAYNNDPSVKITLAEGKVDIHGASKKVSLVPGQQAEVKNGDENIKIKKVDISEALAWKDGWFSFRNESVENVMKQVARWYDVEVQFEGKGKGKKLGGTILRYKDISELLENLKIITGIDYKINGRKITLIN